MVFSDGLPIVLQRFYQQLIYISIGMSILAGCASHAVKTEVCSSCEFKKEYRIALLPYASAEPMLGVNLSEALGVSFSRPASAFRRGLAK